MFTRQILESQRILNDKSSFTLPKNGTKYGSRWLPEKLFDSSEQRRWKQLFILINT